MKYKLDDNKPIPTRIYQNAGKTKWPLADMKIGQSFFVPGYTVNIAKDGLLNFNISHVIANNFPDRKYTTRSVVENNIKGVRCWRIE